MDPLASLRQRKILLRAQFDAARSVFRFISRRTEHFFYKRRHTNCSMLLRKWIEIDLQFDSEATPLALMLSCFSLLLVNKPLPRELTGILFDSLSLRRVHERTRR